MKTSVSARVSADIVSAAREKARAERLSLSAIVERALADYLESADESPDKPAWAIALEQRVSQLESQPDDGAQLSRKAKRRR